MICWHKHHSWYFKIVSNFTRPTAREITYNNFEISLVVFMPNITTNHAMTCTNCTCSAGFTFVVSFFYLHFKIAAKQFVFLRNKQSNGHWNLSNAVTSEAFLVNDQFCYSVMGNHHWVLLLLSVFFPFISFFYMSASSLAAVLFWRLQSFLLPIVVWYRPIMEHCCTGQVNRGQLGSHHLPEFSLHQR